MDTRDTAILIFIIVLATIGWSTYKARTGVPSSVPEQAAVVTATSSASIAGTWKSDQDSKFVRQFGADGSVQDFYEGKLVASGAWLTFTSSDSVATPFPLEHGAVYVQIKASDAQGETLYFKVAKLTPAALELIYMDRGGVNSFVRVK